MKLGEIKLEALVLMSPNNELMCDTTDDGELRAKIKELASDANYSDLLVSMPGAINRCFSLLENRGVVPTRSHELDSKKGKKRGKHLLFNLEEIGDLGIIDRVAYYTDFSDISRCDYTQEGASTILVEPREGQYVVIYTPVVERISLITDDARVIKLPEDVCSLIPYFIKSELLRAENEKEAAVARNTFEGMISELACKRAGYQSAVESIFEVPR